MATIYLIRHCESEGNACRRAQAQTDALVTRKGYAQNEALRQYFSDIPLNAVYASDTFRAVKTVEPIALEKGIPLRVRFLLREITTGIWEDMAWGNIAEDYPEEHRVWTERSWHLITPGASSYQELSARVVFCLQRIAREVGPDGAAAVSSHSCSIKAALCAILGRPFEEVLQCGHGENCSISKLNVDENGKITALYTHDSAFLPKHLTRAWGGIAGSDINMVVKSCRLPHQLEILLDLAQADAAERGEHFDRAEYAREAEARLASDPDSIALAFLHKEPVGYVRFSAGPRLPADCGLAERMYMVPRLQQKGYGEQLLGHATHEMRYRDLRRVAVPLNCSAEEQRVVDRFLFDSGESVPGYQVMDLFCPHLDYPVLP